MSESSHKISKHLKHRGITIPTFLYGTDWKEDQTETLTLSALEAGFVGIDTANQRRHYYEAGVGKALQKALSENNKQRSDFFLQTKFTYISKRLGCSAAQAVFRFALQVGMIPLTGTSNKSHMEEDLASYEIELTESEIDIIENITF